MSLDIGRTTVDRLTGRFHCQDDILVAKTSKACDFLGQQATRWQRSVSPELLFRGCGQRETTSEGQVHLA